MDLREEIEKVAYGLYEKTGQAGRDLENWLEAEKIVLAKYARKEAVTVQKAKTVVTDAASKAKKPVKEKVAGVKTAAKKTIAKRK